jgi:hypothetical protein
MKTALDFITFKVRLKNNNNRLPRAEVAYRLRENGGLDTETMTVINLKYFGLKSKDIMK